MSTYNFSGVTSPSSTHVARAGSQVLFEPGLEHGAEFSSADYADIAASDADSAAVSIGSSAYDAYLHHTFAFAIDEPDCDVDVLTVLWRGYLMSYYPYPDWYRLSIYDHSASAWHTLASITPGTGEHEHSAELTDPADYVSDGQVLVRAWIYGGTGSKVVSTDTVSLTVTPMVYSGVCRGLASVQGAYGGVCRGLATVGYGVYGGVSRGLARVQDLFGGVARGLAGVQLRTGGVCRGLAEILNQYGGVCRGLAGVLNRYSGACRGLGRVATDADPYLLYVGVDGAPDFGAAPAATSATPEIRYAAAPGHVYHLVARTRNPYGLESLSITPTLIEIDDDGHQVTPAPSTPDPVSLSAEAGVATLAAFYRYGADPAARRADRFALWLTTDGAAPDPTSDPTDTAEFVEADGLAKYLYSTTSLAHATVVRAVVCMQRNDGTAETPVWRSSDPTDELTLTIDLQAPDAADRAALFFGATAEQQP